MNRLDVVLAATLDASGNGTASVSVPWGQVWTVTTITTQTNQAASSTTFPTFSAYRGSVDPSNLIVSTYSGQRDTASGSPETFFAGEVITVQWLGGVAATRGTAHVIGTVEAM